MRGAAGYVAATRRIRPDFIGVDYYQQIFDAVHSSLSHFRMTPNFYVTYSTERTCETVRLKTGSVVIYDQYLGQSFNQLNRFWLNADSSADVIAYAFKIMAEHAQIKGHLHTALPLALSYRVMQQHGNSHRKDVDFRRRTLITYIQELFVITHEAMHSVFENDPEWLGQACHDARRDFLMKYFLPRAESLEAHFEAEHLEIAGATILRQMERVATDDALVEECVCDTMAVAFVWTVLSGRADFDAATTRSAIYFALRHLRLLAILRKQVDELGSNEEDEDAWLDPYLCRTQFLQWMLREFEPTASLLASDVSERAFMAEQRRYEEFVENPVLFELPERLRRSKVAQTVGEPILDFEALNHQIDDILANTELNEKMRQLGEAGATFPFSLSNVEMLDAKRAWYTRLGLDDVSF